MRNVDKLFLEELKMKIKNGKLVDYNYEDIKSIVLDAAIRWTREEHHDLVNTLIDEIHTAHMDEFRKRFVKKLKILKSV